MKKIFLPVILALTLLNTTAMASISDADQKTLGDAFALFKKGAYSQAIQKAQSVHSADNETIGSVAFFTATAYAKMQDFEKANSFYRTALNAGNKTESLHYDYGQSLFASQKLKEAEEQFKKSIVKDFKVGASAYYVGFIRQTLEDPTNAKDYYSRLQRMKNDDDHVKQPALYQIADMTYESVAEEKNKKKKIQKLDREVLPLFKKARDYASDTPTYEQAQAKITQIEAEISSEVDRMVNGNPIPKQAWSLRLTQDFGYDSNVITQADQAVITISDKDSFYLKTALLGKYQMNFDRRYSITPELNTYAQLYLRRSTPRVYSNDNIVIAPAIRGKYEHFVNKKPATTLMDLEFNLMLRDYNIAHKFPYYSRYWNYMVGERVKWFDTGTTTIKASIKLFESYSPGRNSYTPQLSFQQNIKIFDKWDLSSTFTADYLIARDALNDERNYKIAESVTLTKLFEKVDVTPGFTFSAKDTMKQRNSRGIELLYNPNVSFSRELINRVDTDLSYDFTRNISRSRASYQYSKHEVKFTAAYNF